MSEKEQRDGRAERMDDLEVRDDDARDVAGGKKAEKKGGFGKKRNVAADARSPRMGKEA